MDTGRRAGRREPSAGFHCRGRPPPRPAPGRLPRPARLVGRASRPVLEPGLGFLRRHRRQGRAAGGRPRQDAGHALSPGCDTEFRREPAAALGQRRGDRVPRRGQGRHPADLGRARRAGFAGAAGVARRRRRGRRPGRRHAAERPGRGRDGAGDDLDRRDLVVLLARFRRARRARPFRADRAQGVRGGRRLLVQRQADPACG